MILYRFFALDSFGRIDRGFEQRFHNDNDAIHFADTIEGASVVEVMRAGDIIAQVRNHRGKRSVVGALAA